MEINRDKKKVISIEDPVERLIPNVTQSQISDHLTWKDAIKSAVRSDPDVILVGEIRDQESANLAFEAARTGHLVLCTIHANDTAGIIDRLIYDFNITKNAIADTLILGTAQRLVTSLCQGCKIKSLNGYQRGNGCELCHRNTIKGVNGRQSVIEHILFPKREIIMNFDRDEFSKHLQTSLKSEILRLIKIGEASIQDGIEYLGHDKKLEYICQ
jgi:type II secretory ATPase GspE/PulE/Tfp pilus assembly ATPase PilB-like protein